LLRRDGGLGGCLRVQPPPHLRIGRVAVAADLRRQARRLMIEALELCRVRWPARALRLTARLPLAGFCESLGFLPISQPFDDFGVTHLRMRRRPR
jgi:ElaA protein